MTSPVWWETRRFAFAAMLIAAQPLIWLVTPPLTDLPVSALGPVIALAPAVNLVVTAIPAFPRAAFAHVRLIRPHPHPAPPGLIRLWSNGDSALYAIDPVPTRLPVGAAPQ